MTQRTPEEIAREADHDRIWLEPLASWSELDGRLWCEDKVWPEEEGDPEPTEYVRADLAKAALRSAVEAEREACAKVAEDDAVTCRNLQANAGSEVVRVGWASSVLAGQTIAEAIRARGKA